MTVDLDKLIENLWKILSKTVYPTDKNVRNIFDNRFFRINKWLLISIGLWPYYSKRKLIRAFWFCIIAITSLPHIIYLKMNSSVSINLLEQIVINLHMVMAFTKLLTFTLSETKMEGMYEIIAENWRIITDEEEKKILINYSHRGRYYTIIYSLFITTAGTLFIIFPLMPALLYKINVLPSPQPHMYIMNGEFVVKDRDSYYWQTYVFDCITTYTAVLINVSTDGIYRVCSEQCFALYAIITHRLSKLHGLSMSEISKSESETLNQNLQIIRLHKRALRLSKSLQEAFSPCILILMLVNVLEIALGCNMIILTLHSDPLFCFRVSSIIATTFVHLLWVCWPGQKIIDYSSRLSFDVYSSDWYQFSKKSQTLLKILMLRCREPVHITAGCMFNINIEIYASTMRTALSYAAVLHQVHNKIT